MAPKNKSKMKKKLSKAKQIGRVKTLSYNKFSVQ